MVRRLLLIFVFTVSNIVSAEAQELSGTVVDSRRQPLQDVSIILENDSAGTLAFTFTDEKGNFSIESPEDTTSTRLIFRLLGYETISVGLGTYRDKQTVVMPGTSIQLKEVNVRGHRIVEKGDTLNYLVSGFKQSQDRSIADVIAKMPGLEVKPSGLITFEGKPINKFYIEGMDLMGRKYSQASENLSADKVKSVQVFQNHQPIKSLSESEFSEYAALNIKLTDDAKSAWAGVLEARGGATEDKDATALYGSKLMAMLFSKKRQNLSVYKCDNSGRDIAREQNYLTREGIENQEEKGLLRNISSAAPDLDKRRTTFNTTHLASFNHLAKTSRDNDFRVQLDYLWNRNKADVYKEITYNDLSGVLICEDTHVSAINHQLKGEIKYEVNKDKIYLFNRLYSSLNFDKSNGETTLNGMGSRQNVRPRKHYFTEDFRMILPMSKGRSVKFGSLTTYSHLPGRLLTFDGYNENLTLNTLESHSHVAFGHKIRNFNVSYQAGIKFMNQRMHVAYDKTDSRERFSWQDLYLQATVNYAFRDLKLKAELTADGQHRSFGDSDNFHPMLLPSVSLSYQVTAKSTIRANYKYSETSNTLTDLFQTPTYTSYHTKEANGGLTNYSGNHTSALMWSYKHPIKGNFIDVIVSWQRRNNIVLYRNSYHNQVLMREATDQRSSANSYFIRKSVAHAFSWAKAFLSFSSEYSLRKYRLLQGEKQIPNRVANATFELKFSMQPSDFFSCELKSRMDVCKWKSEKDGQNPDADKTTHSKNSLTLFFFPVKGMEIGCVNEWYYNVVKSISNHYFLDSYIAYRTKKYELRLDLYNLIGDGKYENQILSTTTNVYALYKLRQREGLLTFGVNL